MLLFNNLLWVAATASLATAMSFILLSKCYSDCQQQGVRLSSPGMDAASLFAYSGSRKLCCKPPPKRQKVWRLKMAIQFTKYTFAHRALTEDGKSAAFSMLFSCIITIDSSKQNFFSRLQPLLCAGYCCHWRSFRFCRTSPTIPKSLFLRINLIPWATHFLSSNCLCASRWPLFYFIHSFIHLLPTFWFSEYRLFQVLKRLVGPSSPGWMEDKKCSEWNEFSRREFKTWCNISSNYTVITMMP